MNCRVHGDAYKAVNKNYLEFLTVEFIYLLRYNSREKVTITTRSYVKFNNHYALPRKVQGSPDSPLRIPVCGAELGLSRTNITLQIREP